MDLPFTLRQALENGSCVLFVGAGMGHYMVDSNGDHIPDGIGLAKRLADKFNVPVSDGKYDLAKISQYIEVKNKGRKELIAFIKESLAEANPDENMMWIPSIQWKAIFTTNYDNVIQLAYDRYPTPTQNYVTISRSTGIKNFNSLIEVPILHLHGSLFEEHSPDIIITQQDFIKYKQQRKMMFEYLKQQMVMSCVLYIGYSHDDPNWNMLITELEEEFYPETIPTAYRVDPFTGELDRELLKAKNIITISQKFDEFVLDARTQIISTHVDTSGLERLESRVPSDFISHYKTNPTAILRIFSSWEYVNQIDVQKLKPNVHNYVRGDKPNWGIIFNNLFFSRDIENEAYEALIDYATETPSRARVCIITGSAGYGVSTLLMTLAARLVKDRAGKVFFHRYPGELREGDVFYSLSLSDDKCFFFIDNAADHTSFIRKTLQHARESRKSIMFVLGDRINEWKQATPYLRGDTFELKPLSDSEIETLIDFLGKNNELNRLEHLPREHQVAAIQKNYNRELLVAIREATEGRNIDAIIEDEFFGIKDEFSQRVYLYICCFNQHGALLRVDLLSNLLGVCVLEFYDKTKGFLDGVIRIECIDDNRGEYAARARHRLIATIVWDRCINTAYRDEIIHLSLDRLNILYRVDKDAFDSFIKSDRFIDSLKNLESKIRFYEKACKKDPDNPYVRQHYARMHIRSGYENAALTIVEEAIKMDKTIRVLHHTKGYILSCMAISSESEELGKRRLLQSEESYFTALRMNDKDEYSYHGLAQLYLGWAKKVTNEEERSVYINKAEDIINDGMKKARDKEALWIESANIDAFIGDNPSRVRSLEAAVRNTPGSIIARYLLAKAYNFFEQYDKSMPLLAELTKEHPDEYRPSIEYGLTILKAGGSLASAIAVLEQSTLYGYSDPKFVATLGGLLFLNKEFSKADTVFSESIKREFPYARSVFFDPARNAGLDLEYEATVKYVGDRYSYIFIPGFPDVFCPSSKYHGLVLCRGMKLKMSLVFTPLKPIANILHEI